MPLSANLLEMKGRSRRLAVWDECQGAAQAMESFENPPLGKSRRAEVFLLKSDGRRLIRAGHLVKQGV